MSEAAPDAPADFDEAFYLALNPDVATAVAAGEALSGRDHFVRYGAREGRRYLPPPEEMPEPVVVAIATLRADGTRAPPAPAFRLEAVRMSPIGGVVVMGWIDDATDPLAELLLEGEGWQYDLVRVSLARTRRRDVQQNLGARAPHPYGFWSFLDLGHPVRRHAACRLTLRLASGAGVTLESFVQSVPDAELRDAALAWLVESDWSVSTYIGAVFGLSGGAGAQIVANNRRIVACVVAEPYAERFGPQNGRAKASIVVCLYGRPEYLAIQNTLFAGGAGIEDYEFVYVCNSPDLCERLLRDARIGSLLYGTRQTVVLLPANAGFGAANNVGARFAASDRIVACNPDVIPYRPDWARQHTDVVENLPVARTDLFGVPLYYETGSLMHGGMFFQIDVATMTQRGGVVANDLVRVQHYGKGAPPESAALTRARPVPAVTGAFISCRRAWFEKLGGFSEDYVFGHYEDADLCLRSLGAGTAPWLHDIAMYHIEGAGSTRGRAQEGALFVNRWLFASRWAGVVRDGLRGPCPTHPLLAEPDAATVPRRRRR